MKYKVGDEVLLRAKITEVRENTFPNLPYMAQITSMGEWKGVGVESVVVTEINEDAIVDMTAEDAWKLAGKIMEMPCGELAEIFPECKGLYIMRYFSLQETKAKIEAWEAEKEIKVGDVVRAEDSTKAVVLDIHDKYFDVLVENGCAEEWYKDKVTKTGKQINIQGLLEQIGGAE